MSGLAATFPFIGGKQWTAHDTTQITNYDGKKIFARGLSCYTTAGIAYVRMRAGRIDPTDDLNYDATAYNTTPHIVYLSLGSYFIGEFDIVYTSGLTAAGIMVWW